MKFRWFMTLYFFIFVAFAVLNSGNASAQHLRLERVPVMDHHGFDPPLSAFSFLLPQGWQPQGGVTWNDGNFCNQAGFNFDWQATSPDGMHGVQVLPQIYWASQPSLVPQAQGNCIVGGFSSVEELITRLVPHYWPGTRILAYRSRPDILEQTGLQAQQEQLYDVRITQTVDAGEALIGYTVNGREMRRTIMLAMRNTQMDLAMPDLQIPGMPTIQAPRTFTGNTMPGFSAFAPDGQLNFKLAEMMRNSVEFNPKWRAAITEHMQRIAAIAAKGADDRRRIIAQTHADISSILSSAYQNRSAVTDRLQRESSETILGVETYRDPSTGGTIQLDNTYEHAWQMQDGSYVLTNDDLWEPQENARKLQPLQ